MTRSAITMLRQFSLCMGLALITLYIQGVFGYASFMYAVDFSYTMEETLECMTTKSVLQCGVRCSLSSECAAVEFQDENSTCVILKSVTMQSELMNKTQFVKLVSAEGVFGLSSYFMTNAAHTATECQRVCAMYGGYLATVTSIEENNFINDLRKGQSIFIGGKKTNAEAESSTWTWVNGEDWAYTNWRPGEPNSNDMTPYIVLWSSSNTEWDDGPCHKILKCMCEKKLA